MAKTAKPNPKRKENSKQYHMPGFLRIMLAILFLMLFSILFTWFVLYRQQLNDVDATWDFVTEKPLIFWYSCVIMFFMISFISALCWRVFIGAGISFSILSVVTYINAEKFKLRHAPLLPEEFQMAGNVGELMDFIDSWGVVRLVAGIVFILIGAGLLEHWVRKTFGRDKRKLAPWQRWALLPRATFALLAAVGFIMSMQCITDNIKGGGGKIEWLDVDFVAWNQTDNYEANGFIIGFLYNLSKPTLEPPEDYTAENILAIRDKYRIVQAKQNTEREELGDVVDNVIVVLDETFYDPEILDKYYPHVGGDPLPNLHKIFEKYPSGYMYSPEYGGGTANVEFEVMTGLSVFWLNSMPYTSTLSKMSNFPSVANSAKEEGFETTALHAYDGSIYKRSLVYPNIGYDVFIDSGELTHNGKENGNGYISDSEIYQEALDILEGNGSRHMIGIATMQNHAPACIADYDQLDYAINTDYDTLTNRVTLACSFQSMHNADKYLGEFLGKLDKLKEKTVVLWFGDHAAGALDVYVDSDSKSDRDLAHLTPYFVYTNFELDVEDNSKAVQAANKLLGFNLKTKGIDLPLTTPNCLANTMYNLLSVKKPAMMYILDEVCTETPILARAYYDNSDPLVQSEALHDYELLNYDLLSGERYWQN